MKIIVIFVLLLSSCAHLKNPSSSEIMTYCQDLNVLYLKMQLIASNIANISTTRTIEGGYYKRKFAKNCKNGFCEIAVDESVPILKYEPKHPDANKKGYVAYPNINMKAEELDQLTWKQVYETVTNNSPVPGNFFFKDKRANICFNKFPILKENLDFSSYLGRETNLE